MARAAPPQGRGDPPGLRGPAPLTAPLALAPGEPLWPPGLAGVPSAPKRLFAIGDPAILSRPCVAIVGTRHPTPYGLRVAGELAATLARSGACVVSGMAFGIDAAAHDAALAAGGATAAVLGAGIDQIYPPAHRRLYERIADRGVVLSEFPPGYPSFKGCFPRRNRIVAALSRLTIVVEAGERSGALITAGYALQLTRDVAAVPGPITSEASAGTNQLLRDGAHVIATIDDALALARFTTRVLAADSGSAGPAPDAGSDEAAIWALLGGTGLSTDDLVQRTQWPPARCLVAISNLEIRGLVSCSPAGGVFRR